jgi:hypothetical protein
MVTPYDFCSCSLQDDYSRGYVFCDLFLNPDIRTTIRALIAAMRWYARDAMSQQPQLKSAPVAIRRKGFGVPEQWLLDRYDDLAGKSIEPYAARTIGGTINEDSGCATEQPWDTRQMNLPMDAQDRTSQMIEDLRQIRCGRPMLRFFSRYSLHLSGP